MLLVQRALLKIESSDDPQAAFDHFFAKTPIPYTCEWKEVDRQLKILMKSELNGINYKIISKEGLLLLRAIFFFWDIYNYTFTTFSRARKKLTCCLTSKPA